MTRYTQVPLGEICTVNPRAKRTGCPDDTVVSFVPMAAVDELAGEIAVRQERPLSEVAKGYTSFEDGDILFAKITPCMENGKVALARNLTNGIGRGSTEFYVLRPGEQVLGEYIYHFVRQPRFRDEAKRNFTGTAGQQRVPKPFMQNASIPVPPLDEQQRIVAILNRAAKIERLRKRAQEGLREFIPALFVRMFGDPEENPKGWETRRLGELVSEFRYGTSKKCSTEASDGYLPILRIPNVVRNVIDWNKMKFATLDEKEASALRLDDGDILFVRTNGNPEYIGRCAVYRGSRPAAYASYLIRARLASTSLVASEYVAGSLSTAVMRKVILRLARTTAGNYNINIASLGSLPLPIPPLDLQDRYASLVESVRSTIAVADTSFETMELSAALMSRLLAKDA